MRTSLTWLYLCIWNRGVVQVSLFAKSKNSFSNIYFPFNHFFWLFLSAAKCHWELAVSPKWNLHTRKPLSTFMTERNTNKDKQSDKSDLRKRPKASAFRTQMIGTVSKKISTNIFARFARFLSLMRSEILEGSGHLTSWIHEYGK